MKWNPASKGCKPVQNAPFQKGLLRCEPEGRIILDSSGSKHIAKGLENPPGLKRNGDMLGKRERGQEELFVACSLRDLVPDDYILKRVDKLVDFSWLRDEVRDLYDESTGRPSIDPEAAVRLMLAGFFHGIVHDRKLMREARMHIGIRWFAGYRLHEKLPHHSSLTRIRQRWGPERFKRVFEKTVQACMAAGLVDGETVHADATLIRVDVSWESLVEQHAEKVIAENDDESTPPKGPGRPPKREKKPKKVSTTDPDATLTTSKQSYRMEPSFKQHTAVDDKAGVIVDVEVTTGEASEGGTLLERIEEIETTTGRKIETLTADAGYAHSANYAALEERGTDAVIPPQKESTARKAVPLRRFKYDAKHDIVKCPKGKMLRKRYRQANGWVYRARARDCAACPLRAKCFKHGATRAILIVNGYPALLRARRRRGRWREETIRVYQRHRWRVEGIHGEAKTQHGLRRAVRRGLANVAIQVYLTAAVMNLKRLAALLCLFFVKYFHLGTAQDTEQGSQENKEQEQLRWEAVACFFSKAA